MLNDNLTHYFKNSTLLLHKTRKVLGTGSYIKLSECSAGACTLYTKMFVHKQELQLRMQFSFTIWLWIIIIALPQSVDYLTLAPSQVQDRSLQVLLSLSH